MKKHITAHVIFAATALASQHVWGLGFGRVVPDAVLGRPLFFSAPVHVDAGEHFGSECVSAEVYFGDTRVNPVDVRTSVERTASDNDWVVKISTIAPIGEPIVEVAISAGCDRRFVRRFTAFADPPNVSPATIAAAKPGTVVLPAQGNAAARRSAPAPGDGGGTARLVAVPRKGPTLALANELNSKPRAGSRHVAVPAESHKPGARTAPPPAAPRLVLDGGYARLKLDMEDPVVPATGAASAAEASVALSDLDDPTTQQLRLLEKNIQQMKRDNQASREQTAKLQQQLAEAQSRNDLLPWVVGLLGLALAAAVALALKLRQQTRLAHQAWFDESRMGSQQPPVAAPEEPPPPTAPVPPQLEDRAPSGEVDLLVDPLSPDDEDEHSGAVVADMSLTLPLDRAALSGLLGQAEAATPRELSVEELLDLEQQADFFIALGQEDAAVDLLMSHLRSAGGQSPLPYTKLLEIYRRQGDRSAYERTRARFNRRFNAYAPDWDTGPTAGRSLEDYPDTIAHVQAMWNSPIDAMAFLEAMLFKRDETSELFDLPAYRDVLLLYSLARDLWQLGGGLTGTQVDVLLPLDGPDSPAALAASGALPPLGGLDLPMEGGEPETYEMTGFEPLEGRGEIDLQVPMDVDAGRGGQVHATLDAMSLAPVEPTKGPAAPDWHSGADDDLDPPRKR